MKVFLNRGSIVIEEDNANSMKAIEERLRDLRVFRREDGSGEGHYEDLFSLPLPNKILTMPGFASRIIGGISAEGDAKIVDGRIPMPDPDYFEAVGSCDGLFRDTAVRAIMSCGGTVCIPHSFGFARMATAIIRAFGSKDLAMRGTPLSLVVSPDQDSARYLHARLRAEMPERDVGLSIGQSLIDSDDVIVTDYGSMCDLPLTAVGVVVAQITDSMELALEPVSSVRNAARWGILATFEGGDRIREPILCEGLFGPVVASATHADAVADGSALKVSVHWIRMKQPSYAWSASFRFMESVAMTENPDFCETAAGIISKTPDDMGAICCCANLAIAERIAKAYSEKEQSDIPVSDRRMKVRDRRNLFTGIENGTVRKAIVTADMLPPPSEHRVVILATCGGAEVADWRIPTGKPRFPGESAHVFTFENGWDFHNGRPGHLAIRDGDRRKRFGNMGFFQDFQDPSRLPFLI